MSINDPSGICLRYGTVAAEQEGEKEEAGAILEPDQGRHALEPTLIRSTTVAEESVEPLGHNNIGSDTNLPMQTSGRADLFAAVTVPGGPSFQDQTRQTSSPATRKPSATSPFPSLNNIMKSDSTRNDASLSQVVTGDDGDVEPVMIDAHDLENDGTDANLAAQSTALDGNVYDAAACALTGGYFEKCHGIFVLFVLAAAAVVYITTVAAAAVVMYTLLYIFYLFVNLFV